MLGRGNTNMVNEKRCCVLVPTKVCGEWTQTHKNITFALVVNGAWTQTKQQDINGVNNDRCMQCGEERSAVHKLY